MKVFDIATRQVMQGGKQRGANMGILAASHPDIMEFITCKSEEGEISNFNISVGADDKFMSAVEKDTEFNLINPRSGKPVQKVSGRLLMDQIVSLAWRTGDPGMTTGMRSTVTIRC
jgi:ribonucleoside-diphosphate reductase alpha chain